ncbi:hypothetical protein GCM10017608_25860 [Agromyces luteolus]|uniref:Uncharacterized protein n=1 Tax=Agromyces luteolus TaxID=88373 RepID=A0A7C9HJZ2_9MICO|nr:hypothetical protein [Agromyces luteolus]MUN08963.1 hypothetical protein [Agromyces luteolus]GLK28651.1 hypothetical protein GCM10017608_25860 [Agromyces luteolus]
MPSRTGAPRARLALRVELVSLGGDPPWRTISIDPAVGLDRLADAIMLAFGWTGAGSWRFGTRHTPWWGRDADAWGSGILTPARPIARRAGGEGGSHFGSDGYRYGVAGSAYDEDPYADDPCGYDGRTRQHDREWNVDQVVERFGGELEFEYRQVDLGGVRGSGAGAGAAAVRSGPTWRHRIVVDSGLDAATSDTFAPSAALLGGAGTVPRLGTEAAYGELGDPSDRAALDHEFDLMFGSTSFGLPFDGPTWAPLDAALSGSSAPARRALRMDLFGLGALEPPIVDGEQVVRALAPIRELLRSGADTDGVDIEAAGALGDDLKTLRLARVQKGILRTYVTVRDTLLDDPLALWHTLAERLMHDSSSSSYRSRSDVAERAVDLVCGDRDVRRFAFDEAHRRSWSAARTSEFGPTRLDRMLATLELVDAEGRIAHPNARAFGIAMLRSAT